MTNPAAGDCRRALAAIQHHTFGDIPGVKAVIDEVNQTGRGTNFYTAVIDGYQFIVGELRTAPAVEMMSEIVHNLAHQTEDSNVARAARAITAYQTFRFDDFNTCIAETVEHNLSGHLVRDSMTIFNELLPELCTELGRQCINDAILQISEQENGE